MRRQDGSAGDTDYGQLGGEYANYRRADARISSQIEKALGAARKVLNVGAGTGSYEPSDREITAVEPSLTMRRQRAGHLARAIDAVAERLPFADHTFDAAMATFTVHQWADLELGIREMRRVTRGPVLILTCDPKSVEAFWLARYAPLVLRAESRRYPQIGRLVDLFQGEARVEEVPIPLDCSDGFNEAYYGRPEALLDEGARRSNSAWSFVNDTTRQEYVLALQNALEDGRWDAEFGPLRHQRSYRGSLRLVIGGAGRA